MHKLVPETNDTKTLFPQSAGRIHIPENRLREINQKEVDKLKISILAAGCVFSPVPYRDNPIEDGYIIIAGAHRVTAVLQLWSEGYDEIRLPVIPFAVTNESALVLEIRENLDRYDLSPEERDNMSAKLGILMGDDPVSSSGTNDVSPTVTNDVSPTVTNAKKKHNPKGSPPETWFTKWQKEANYPKQTASRRWNAYAKAAGLPAKAKPGDHQDHSQLFFSWLGDKADTNIAAGKKQAEIERKEKQTKDEQAAIDAIETVDGLWGLSTAFKKQVREVVK